MLRILNAIVNFAFSVLLSFAALITLFLLPPLGLALLFGLHRSLLRSARPAAQGYPASK